MRILAICLSMYTVGLCSTIAAGQDLPTRTSIATTTLRENASLQRKSKNKKNKKIKPNTTVEIPTYKNGKKKGKRRLSVEQFWDRMDDWERSKVREHKRDRSGPQVEYRREHDSASGGVIDQVYVPQEVPQREKLEAQQHAAAQWQPQTEVGPRQLSTELSRTFGDNSTFGAFLSGSFEAQGDSRSVSAQQDFAAGGFVFGKRITLLSQSTDLRSADKTAAVDIKILDETVFISRDPVLVVEKSFVRSRDAKRVFVLGIVPVSVRGKVSGSMGASLDYALDGTSISGTVKPFVNTQATASAGVDLFFVRAGIQGRLTFVNDTLTSTFQADLRPRERALHLSMNANNRIQLLSGNISLFATIVRFLRPDRKFTKSIFSFDGITSNDPLIDQQTTIRI